MIFIAQMQNLPAYLQVERWNKIIMLFRTTHRFRQLRQRRSKFPHWRLASLQRKAAIIKKKNDFGTTFFMQINSWAYILRRKLWSHPL